MFNRRASDVFGDTIPAQRHREFTGLPFAPLAYPTTAREVLMSLKDKLEIGLKPDAPFRKDNLPEFQKDDPACVVAATPSDTPSVERARKDGAMPPVKQEQVAKERASAEDGRAKR